MHPIGTGPGKKRREMEKLWGGKSRRHAERQQGRVRR